jgi:hypothetical protein
MTECVIYLQKMATLTGHTPLMSKTKWKNTSDFTVIKKRPYDIENCEIELSYAGDLSEFDYAYIEYNASPAPADAIIPCVYRITGIRQGDSIRSVAGSGYTDRINGTAVLSLELDALATWYVNATGAPSITARWSHLPMQAVVEPFQVRPAQMMRTSTQALPRNIPDCDNSQHYPGGGMIMWCECTFIDSSGNFKTNGTFTSYTEIWQGGSGNQQYPTKLYPSYTEIMNDPVKYMGAYTASSVVSINLSVRCPYAVFKMNDGATNEYPTLITDSTGNPTFTNKETYRQPNNVVAYFVFENYQAVVRKEIMNGEIVLTEMQRNMGQVKIYDVCNTMIAAIDTRYAKVDNGTLKIKYQAQTINNLNTLQTRLILEDGTEVRFPEAMLPYNGSAYQEYAVAQMGYDRELLAMNQEKVMVDTALGLTGSIANGAIASISSAGLGAGTAAIGIAGNVVGAYMTMQQNQRTQEAKENLMRNTPDTLYNSMYGTDYVNRWVTTQMPGFAAVNMPDGVTESEMIDFIDTHGYPVTDIPLGVTAVHLNYAINGFLQATRLITATIGGKTGEYFRILDKQLRNGVLFKVIT